MGFTSLYSQGSTAPGSCLLEFADPGAFAPEAKLRSWAGGLDFCSSAASSGLPSRALLQHARVAAEGTGTQASPQPWQSPLPELAAAWGYACWMEQTGGHRRMQGAGRAIRWETCHEGKGWKLPKWKAGMQPGTLS